jgi:hypothetical protein
MKVRFLSVLAALMLSLGGCGDDGGDGSGGSGEGSAVSDEEYEQACDNGVALCMDDPQYGATFGAQDCSPDAIASAYANCDSDCRAQSEPIIDCQIAATDCEGFVGCAQ